MRLAIIAPAMSVERSEPPGRKKSATRFFSASGIQCRIKRKRWCDGWTYRHGP